MTYRLRISRRALADADEAYEWMCDNLSQSYADRWYEGLLATIEELALQPMLHPHAMESHEHPIPIREALYGRRKSRHRILFTVQDDEVVVLYIHHSSRGKLEP